MKCGNCKRFLHIANTDSTGMGVCSYPNSYSPVSCDDDCSYIPTSYICSDCMNYYEDMGCYEVESGESAYINGKLCAGFIDRREQEVYNSLIEWKLRGFNIEDKIKEILKNIEDNYEFPFQPRENIVGV